MYARRDSLIGVSLSHLFVGWWVNSVMIVIESEKKWLSILVGQTFHINILGIVLYL
ncbi:hypothetical protein ACM26V_12010 [Salipaludibacillus sp. HK11]|uniref:hypothetical protein n=1 Tax=Salipaludibacillus sp. HK11 TaxID=3394320 RepID=UPI0039FD2A3F